jgi:4,5-DOPA dioxygenase extradiol
MTQAPALFIGHGSPPGLAANGRAPPATARDPGRVGPLVLRSHGGHGHAPGANHPRLLRLSARLNAFQYPAPGAPEIAGEVVEAVKTDLGVV